MRRCTEGSSLGQAAGSPATEKPRLDFSTAPLKQQKYIVPDPVDMEAQ